MTFLPRELILGRMARNAADSDTALFSELLYVGEFLLKITVAAFVSAIEEDREHHRYRLLHGLVRADGIGDWARAFDTIVASARAYIHALNKLLVKRERTEPVALAS